MKAITTKYHGATANRGSRIIASDMDGNRFTLSSEEFLATSGAQGHQQAAEGLRNKMGWTGKLIGGGVKGGMVFVFAE